MVSPTAEDRWEQRAAPRLFATLDTRPTMLRVEPGLIASASRDAGQVPRLAPTFTPAVDDRMLELFAMAEDPTDALELRDLYLGRVECELAGPSLRPELAARWAAARPRRNVSAEQVLNARSTVRLVKELFNWFFRDDLYGELRAHSHTILSSGSVDEEAFGLPEVLKDCVRHALTRDWYGYSDSRGRTAAREAVAEYESARMTGVRYDVGNIALTMGGTMAISMLADFVALRAGPRGRALCGIPGYPPLVEAVARRMDVGLTPLPLDDGITSLTPMIEALSADTPLVLLQTVTNPTGAVVDEAQLAELIRAAGPSTLVILDECHECLGPPIRPCPERAAPNVVRVSSISKTWSAPGLKVGWIVADERFVDEYYEYASTTFGGPPSLLYTLVEVLARMERWMLAGVEAPGNAELAELEPSYGLDIGRLTLAYTAYCRDRRTRQNSLMTLRSAAVAGLGRTRTRVVAPRYSINLTALPVHSEDSYRTFRELLVASGVAVFPTVLCLCLGGGAVRLTTARRWDDLAAAVEALEAHG